MMFSALDLATRRRVLWYIEEQGGVITSDGGDGVLAVELPTLRAVLNVCTLMALDAAEYRPEITALALRLGSPDRVLAWAQSVIEWRDEPGERLSYPTTTLAREWGDCDCSATLVASLWSALGYPSAVFALTLDGDAVHGVAAFEFGGRWMWGDASEPGALRPWERHPLTADARPGVRGVVAPDVVTCPRWP